MQNVQNSGIDSQATHVGSDDINYGFYPYCRARQVWEYIIYFLSMVCLWEIPYEIFFNLDKTFYYVLPALFIDLFYLIDIFIVLRTGVLHYGVVKLDKKSIRMNIPTWKLIVYWLSLWPYYMIGFFAKSKPVFNALVCLKLLRMLRLRDAGRVIKNTLVYNHPVSRFMTLFCILITIAHYCACIFWYTGFKEIPRRSWLVEAKIITKPKEIQYFHALYYITTTILTIGYGDLHPYTFPEVCVVIGVEAVGVFFYNYLVSNMVSIVADPSRNSFLSKYQRIYSAFKSRGVSAESMGELMRYYEYVWERDRDRADFYETASKLPDGLQKKLAYELHADVFEKVAAFQGASREALERVALALIPRIFTPGDFLLKAGRVSNRMYFINEGKVGLINSNGAIVGECDGIDGSVIGEASVLNGTPEQISSIAETYVEAFELLKEDFDEIVMVHPQIQAQLQSKGTNYQQKRSV
ncbi:cation channel family protein [Tritrichomonas foetus]|uniref:Cation channel family protein n=1 Tax=Tritrichomonas foetus TaxID=1144522 RepID=A0A1J4JAL4_9EUKA|nr:cation channel family protein [Tritrichomonas foetus]|eukprot:OHS96218.1 cation channel family protein [Tritrichomonas foetus]